MAGPGCSVALSAAQHPGEARYLPMRLLRDARVIAYLCHREGNQIEIAKAGTDARCYAMSDTDKASGGTGSCAPVLTKRMPGTGLRAYYEVSGTEKACGATRGGRRSSGCDELAPGELRYRPTRLLPDARYQHSVWWRKAYALFGPDLACQSGWVLGDERY
eukprot:2111147-Rhodomonas_salina.5